MSIIKINNKTIGKLFKERKQFVKTVKLSKHLFRILDAWGIDWGFFEGTLLPEDYEILIIDKENNINYYSRAKEFRTNGLIREYGQHGTQIFLPRKYFSTKNPNQKGLF